MSIQLLLSLRDPFEDSGVMPQIIYVSNNFRRVKFIFLALNYRRWSTNFPMPHNKKALSETIEVTQPYLNPTTSKDTMKLILQNIFLPVSVKLGKSTANLINLFL